LIRNPPPTELAASLTVEGMMRGHAPNDADKDASGTRPVIEGCSEAVVGDPVETV
jgi:hypothetical protein